MVHAYLVVDAAAGMAPELLAKIRRVDGVGEAHVVAGEWDLVVELDAGEVYDLLHTVTAEIRPMEGVGTTRCYVCLD